MVYYDTDSRLQLAREQADRLASEMRRTRRVTPDEVGVPGGATLGSALARRLGRLRPGRGYHTPAYNG